MYNLNYRFDSVSPAGKFCGTALDLIKRYNELAKEAHAAGNYVEMEVFRQYAEHYRKIVTEINERRSVAQPAYQSAQKPFEESSVSGEETTEQEEQNQNIAQEPQEVITQQPLSLKKKTLKIVEVKEKEPLIDEEPVKKTKRVYHRKSKDQPTESAAV